MSSVCISGEERYRLIHLYHIDSFKAYPSYILCDLEGNELRRWSFRMGMFSKRMDVGEGADFPMLFVEGAFGWRYFKTPKGKIPPYFETREKSRSIEVDGMRFEHRDYQNKISFRCPPERLQQAIIVANLLFNPPLFEQNG